MKMILLFLLVSSCWGLSSAQVSQVLQPPPAGRDSGNGSSLLEPSGRKENMVVTFIVGGGDRGIVGPFDKNTTFIFKKVKTNIGGAYNASTGITTAPVSGLYYVNVFPAGRYLSFFLYKNGKEYDFKKQTFENSGFLQLKRGDQLHVVLVANAQVASENANYFGFLISQT